VGGDLLIIPISRALRTFGSGLLKRIYGALDYFFHGFLLVGREFFEDELFGRDVAFSCDADAEAPEGRGFQGSDHGLHAFVSGGSFIEREFAESECDVGVVVNEYEAIWFDLEEFGNGRHGAARFVHKRVRERHNHFVFFELAFGDTGVPFFFKVEVGKLLLRAEQLDDFTADVVARVFILAARIAQANDEERRFHWICQYLKVEYTTYMKEREQSGTIGYELWDIMKVLFISLAIVLPVRYFLVQPFIVRGASMSPAFKDSEYLIIDELSYYIRQPERGEVVVFRYPRDPRQFFIKRIIGLPGEEVDIKDGRVMIVSARYPSGFLIDESYLDPPNQATYPDARRKLGMDEYFVLGDNRDFSSDSRVWGILPRKLITGRTLFRVWPPTRLGPVMASVSISM